MRISEQRYARDRQILDVAARLIGFEVRTRAIRELTGLTDDRIRKLSKACGMYGRSTPVTRHRGASPRRVSTMLGKARSRSEAAALLGLCQLMDIKLGRNDAPPVPRIYSVSRSEKLCDAFWTFRYLFPQSSISFEHMLLLLTEAAKGEEMKTTRCTSCKALLVVDALSRYSSMCPVCEEDPLDHRSFDTMPYRCVAEEAPAYR